jgi:DNA-binding winged helix-turn-helix (wHTH) protein
MDYAASPLPALFSLNSDDRVVHRGEKSLRLRPLQFKLLDYLCRRQGVVVTKEELYLALWPAPRPDPGIIDVSICNLRRSLREEFADGVETHIRTVWGIGYVLSNEPDTNPGATFRNRDAWKREKNARTEQERSLITRLERLFETSASIGT